MNKNERPSDPLEILDEVLERIESYMGDTTKLTPETLQMLYDQVSDVRESLTEGEEGESEDEEMEESNGKGGIISKMVSKAKKMVKPGNMAILFFLIIGGIANAEPKKSNFGRPWPPFPSSYVTDAVYNSSITCAGGFLLPIDTHTSILSHISISSAGGSPHSWYQIWDARYSTGVGANPLSGRFSTSVQNTQNRPPEKWWKTGASSGLVLNVESAGGTPPCLEIFYYQD